MRNKNSSHCPKNAKIGGIELKVCMAKVRKFAEITPNLPFTEYNFYDEFRESFEKTEQGRMKKILPLHEMAKSLGLISESLRPQKDARLTSRRRGKWR